MKRQFLTLTVVAASAWTIYGQGLVSFNNEGTFNANDAITIGPVSYSSSAGHAGDGIGGDKSSVQLLWLPGTFPYQSWFDDANPFASAVFTGPVVFLANTGPTATFSGFFDAGVVPIGPAGTYTMQARAWYSVGFPTWAAAQSSSVNSGRSALFTVNVTASPSPINSTVFPGFSVGILGPEPSSLALAILGGALIFLFRRKE